MKFSEILRLLMAENNVTSRQLAKELRIPKYILDHFIHSIEEPDLSTLKQIATYFNVSTDCLLDYHADTDTL